MSPLEKVEGAAEYIRRKRGALDMPFPILAERASAIWQALPGGKAIAWQSIQQLEKGEPKKVPAWFAHVATGVQPDQPEVVPDDIDMIREVDIRYGMGPGGIISDNPETGAVPFNSNFRRTLTNAPVSALFIARGDGDSMMPTLINEDQVLIDTSQNRITQSDKIWALAIGEVGLIKRVQVVPRGGYKLLSDNPLIPPQDVEKDDLVVVGRVVWVGRRL
jgi:phage repressor protein C with HTH and peptisase S24 domain